MAQFRVTRSLRKEKQAQTGSQSKRRQQLRRLAKGAIALAAVAAVVVAYAAAVGPVRLSNMTDSLRLAGRRGDGFPLDGGSGNVAQAVLMGKNLALLWPTKLEVINTSAYQSLLLRRTYTDTALRGTNGRLVQFDRKSGKLMLVSKTGILYEKELSHALFCVGLNNRGDLAAAAGAEGAASEITVWNTKERKRFSWRCEKEYPSALQPSKSGGGIGICLIGTSKASVYSRFVEFKFSKKDPVIDIKLQDIWLYGAVQRGSSWLAITDQGVYRFRRGQETPEIEPYEGRVMQTYSMDESGYCAVLLEDWDNRALLRIYNRSGNLALEQSFKQRPLELTCQGGSVYLRFENTLVRWQKATGFRQSQPLLPGTQHAYVTGSYTYLITTQTVDRTHLDWGAPNQNLF